MSRTTASAAAVTCNAFKRKLTLMWAIGTLLPLGVLACFYMVAPLPMSASTAAILHTANRIAAGVVLAHWAITLLVWAVATAMRTARPARTTQTATAAQWQPVQMHGRASA